MSTVDLSMVRLLMQSDDRLVRYIPGERHENSHENQRCPSLLNDIDAHIEDARQARPRLFPTAK